MEKKTFNEEIQSIKRSLPHGWIKEVIGDNAGARVRLQAVFKRQSLEEMTPGEREVFDKFMAYAEKIRKSNDAIRNKVTQLAK